MRAPYRPILIALLTLLASSRLARGGVLGEGVELDLGVGTAVPVLLGPHVQAELPYRLLLRFDLGWLPAGYVDLINEIGTQFDGYTEATAALVSASSDDSLILRFGGGWRPFSGLGLEVLLGYTLAAVGGDVAPLEMIESETDHSIGGGAISVPLSSVLHGFHVNVAYRWVLWQRLVLRASLGYLQIVGSSTSMDLSPSSARGAAVVKRLEQALDAYLNDVYTTYVKAPVIAVDLAYRF